MKFLSIIIFIWI